MVTVGDMFSHRSGLPDHAGDMLEDLGYDRRYVLERLRDSAARPVPNLLRLHQLRADRRRRGGGRRRGQVVGGPQRRGALPAAGHDLDEFPVRRLRGPAGPGASGHIHVDGKYEPLYIRDPEPEAPAGGVSSSVNDMTHWLAMVLANGSYDGKQIVDPKALLPALTPQIVSSPAERTGDALRLLRLRLQRRHHVGRPARSSATPAPSNSVRAPTSSIIPSADVAIVALTNATPVRRARDADRASSPTWSSSVRCARTGASSTHDAFADWTQPVGLAGRQAAAGQPGAGRSRCRPTSAATPTTTGARPRSPRRTAGSPWRWARTWTLCR